MITRITIPEVPGLAVELNSEEGLVSIVGTAEWNLGAVFLVEEADVSDPAATRAALSTALKQLVVKTMPAVQAHFNLGGTE